MIGHQPLIAMRANERRPRAVWLYDTDADFARQEARDWALHRNCADGAYHAAIRIDAQDLPEALDLRWLKGLTVHLMSDRSPARFHRLFDAAVAAGAEMVVGTTNGMTHFHRTETTE